MKNHEFLCVVALALPAALVGCGDSPVTCERPSGVVTVPWRRSEGGSVIMVSLAVGGPDELCGGPEYVSGVPLDVLGDDCSYQLSVTCVEANADRSLRSYDLDVSPDGIVSGSSEVTYTRNGVELTSVSVFGEAVYE